MFLPSQRHHFRMYRVDYYGIFSVLAENYETRRNALYIIDTTYILLLGECIIKEKIIENVHSVGRKFEKIKLSTTIFPLRYAKHRLRRRNGGGVRSIKTTTMPRGPQPCDVIRVIYIYIYYIVVTNRLYIEKLCMIDKSFSSRGSSNSV